MMMVAEPGLEPGTPAFSGLRSTSELPGRIALVALAALLMVAPLRAQEVKRVPDIASYGTAALNPTVAAVRAWQAPDRACRLKQLALTEAIGNGATLTLKHFIVSPRPCLGCAPDGMPSSHAMNATLGVSHGWNVSWSFFVATAALRVDAHRHTPQQVVAGILLGGISEWAGSVLVRCQ